MPGIDYAAVRSLISIADVLDYLGFRLTRRRGDWLRGICPFGCSDDPSVFVANVLTDRYYCHACHRRGDQLDLWSAFQEKPLHPATRELCLRHQSPVPEIHRW